MTKPQGEMAFCTECGSKAPEGYDNYSCVKPSCIGVYSTMKNQKQNDSFGEAQDKFEESKVADLKMRFIIGWFSPDHEFTEAEIKRFEKFTREAIREAREDTIINILGLYYAVVKDLYGEEIAKLIQSRVNKS